MVSWSVEVQESFFPDNTLTRAEIARMFYKTFFGGKR